MAFTFKKSTINENKQQRFIIRVNSATNFYYALICAIVHPQIEISNDTVLIRCYGLGRYIRNGSVRIFLVGLFIYSYVMIFTIVSVGFVFRYYTLCKRILLPRSKLIRSYLICFGYSIFSGVLYSLNFSPYVPMSFRVKADLNETIWKYEEPSFWDHVLIYRQNNIILLLSFILYTSLTIISYALIIYLVYKMKKLMKNNKNSFSTKTFILQKQLNKILNVQSLTPIFVILLPVLFGFILIISKVRVNGFGLFVILGLEFVPFVNGLSIIILTKDYRIKIRGKKNILAKTTTKVFLT
uniref:G_PROTEIN_RECEP_F1_2 domain-containing protein n=1 Tax=Strongyloides venezuelensis TaxID=75913 RepID=A0A0K0FRQ9_STRVS